MTSSQNTCPLTVLNLDLVRPITLFFTPSDLTNALVLSTSTKAVLDSHIHVEELVRNIINWPAVIGRATRCQDTAQFHGLQWAHGFRKHLRWRDSLDSMAWCWPTSTSMFSTPSTMSGR